jgi:hypothetical protein
MVQYIGSPILLKRSIEKIEKNKHLPIFFSIPLERFKAVANEDAIKDGITKRFVTSII